MKLLSTGQAAKLLRVSERRVRALIAAGKLSAQKLGRDYVIEAQSISAVTVYRKAGRPIKAAHKSGSQIRTQEKPRGKGFK